MAEEIKINIGSGATKWDGWINYDELTYEGVTPLVLSPDVTLPLDSNIVSTVYCSHTFEHLSDATVSRTLDEIWRVMSPGGLFLLKFPDFDWFLEQYRKGNYQCMIGVGIESLLWSHASKDVEDTFENRISAYFCGYWNRQYGDHFSRAINKTKQAYIGPAVINDNDLKILLSTKSPNQISKILTNIAKSDPDFKCFSHQNAWSVPEMSLILKEKNFFLESTDKDQIVKEFEHVIPRFKEMLHFSAYYLIKKKSV